MQGRGGAEVHSGILSPRRATEGRAAPCHTEWPAARPDVCTLQLLSMLGYCSGMAHEKLASGSLGTLTLKKHAANGDEVKSNPHHWTARAWVGLPDGTRKRLYARADSNKDVREALRTKADAAVEASSDAMRGGGDPNSLPIRWDAAVRNHAEWIKGPKANKNNGYKAGTLRVYQTAFDNYILDPSCPFGSSSPKVHRDHNGHVDVAAKDHGERLDSISIGRLESWLQDIANSEGEGGAGAAHTVQAVIAGMFHRAAKDGVVTANPVRGIGKVSRNPGTKAARQDERDHEQGLSVEEQERLRAFVAKNKGLQRNDSADLILFMLDTGVRLGEALALTWADVDLKASPALVSVSATVARTSGVGLHRQSPKTERAHRSFEVLDSVADMLRDRRKRFGNPAKAEPVFPSWARGTGDTATGGALRDPSNITRIIRRVFEHEDVNVPWAVSHTLRRTFINNAIQAGLPITSVSALVGHRDSGFTLTVYGDAKSRPVGTAAKLGQFMSTSTHVDKDVDNTATLNESGEA